MNIAIERIATQLAQAFYKNKNDSTATPELKKQEIAYLMNEFDIEMRDALICVEIKNRLVRRLSDKGMEVKGRLIC